MGLGRYRNKHGKMWTQDDIYMRVPYSLQKFINFGDKNFKIIFFSTLICGKTVYI